MKRFIYSLWCMALQIKFRAEFAYKKRSILAKNKEIFIEKTALEAGQTFTLKYAYLWAYCAFDILSECGCIDKLNCVIPGRINENVRAKLALKWLNFYTDERTKTWHILTK